MAQRTIRHGLWARFAALFGRPQMLAFLPALALGLWWFGAEGAVVVAMTALPLGFLALGERPPAAEPPGRDGATGLPLRDTAVAALDAVLSRHGLTGRTTACLVLGIDEAGTLAERFGQAAHEQILRRTAERLAGVLREEDVLARLDGARFAVALGPVRRADLETAIQIAARLQAAVEQPLSLDAAAVYVSVSAGFCLASRAPERTGEALMAAAEAAMDEARRNGPGAIRAFSPEMQRAIAERTTLREEVEAALEGGQIVAYFQPQISTETGAITGFEALARWLHPARGLLPPAEFLPAIHAAGLSARLGEVMLYHALAALRSWDAAGFAVPKVAVNFSSDELRNPRLAEKLKWELDRFGLAPERLGVEVLESVVADMGDDTIVHTIAALSRLGCGIDLDDFGTGHASIASIRRFDVQRIKIDRSFVTGVDSDPSQQRMVAAILSMAEQLGLQTLAEGVETVGEHAMLAQLGCGHVQGFGIGRPMQFEDTAAWIERHRAKLQAAPKLGRRAG